MIWYLVAILFGAFIAIIIYDRWQKRTGRSGVTLYNEDEARESEHRSVWMKDPLSATPDFLMYEGGYVETYKCTDCGRVSEYYTQNSYRPCSKCGGRVKGNGVMIYERRNGVKGWHPRRNETLPRK